METDAGKVRLKELAAEKLEIPKPMRLTGKDGYIHLPAVPDLFYLSELVVWLRNAIKQDNEYMIAQSDYDFDYTIETVGYDRIKKNPASFRHLKPGIHTLKKAGKFKSIEIFKGLNHNQLSRPNLQGEEYMHYSFSHHRFLERIIYTLQNQYGTFVALLAEKTGAPIRSQEDLYSDALKSLRWLQASILNIEVIGSFRIPELYALRDHGVLMSYSLNEVMQFECEEWGLLYTYRFSKDTSYHFLMRIKDFIAQLIKKYEALEIQQRKEPMKLAATEILDGDLIRRPTSTPDKVNLILELLGSADENKSEDDDKREPKDDELNITSLMILFRVFSKFKIFKQNFEKWRVGIAYHILTGKSYSKFDRLFQKGEIEADTLRKISDSSTTLKANVAIESILRKLNKEILPFLEEIKKLE